MSAFEHFDDFLDPGPQKRRMLEALVAGSPRDAGRWAQWLSELDLDRLDGHAKRLLPALFAKFGPALAEGPAKAKLAAEHRRRLDWNRQLLEDGRRVLEAFAAAGIETLLFKGIAMVLRHHDIGSRPMGDVDVLVHREDVARAEEILERLGWRYLWAGDRKAADVHSHDYVNERRSGFDLHWHALLESARPGIDAGAWARARPFDWEGLATHVMAPEDLLLAVLVNGVRRRYPLALQWLQDVAVLAVDPGLRWDVLWEEARLRGLREAVFDGLAMAAGLSHAIVPESRLHALVDGDAPFAQALLAQVLAEGRAFGVRPAARVQASLGQRADAARHVRFLPASGDPIERIFLHARHLAHVPELFDVAEAPPADARHAFVTLAPRGIAPRARAQLATYGARIEILDAIETLALAPREVRRVPVRVTNTSPCCWPVHCGTDYLFGATYHLLSPEGEVLRQELPRTYLFFARRGYVAFLEPGQSLVRDIAIHGPETPGPYVAQFDLVHENAAWFSEQGCEFPRLPLIVSDTA